MDIGYLQHGPFIRYIYFYVKKEIKFFTTVKCLTWIHTLYDDSKFGQIKCTEGELRALKEKVGKIVTFMYILQCKNSSHEKLILYYDSYNSQ